MIKIILISIVITFSQGVELYIANGHSHYTKADLELCISFTTKEQQFIRDHKENKEAMNNIKKFKYLISKFCHCQEED